ncbi:hypothetical protein LTR04_000546 [Oleoguttula sp. CCFEE 6159]|nr:hypothetical protein LTR04_000546 [Oleoguttula sp. CCFEE 6159]
MKRKREEELQPGDKVVLDVKISRLDPAVGEKEQAGEKWEARPAGVWLKRGGKRHDSDKKGTVTAVDVLFGADAVEPRSGWQLLDTPLLLDAGSEIPQARLSVRRGKPSDVNRKKEKEKWQPRVRKDGKFKIMQVSDLHLSTGTGVCRDPMGVKVGTKCEADTRTLEFVGKMLDEEQPDLVVCSGDQVNGDTAPDGESAIFKFAELFIKRRIPYAAIFGNHDDEGKPSLSRAAQMSLLESLPYSLSEAGPDDVDGIGNYVIEVLAPGTSTHSALTLYLLDTHAYSPDEGTFPGYGWVKPSQIRWFRDTAQDLKKAHSKYTHIHLDMAFIHIPLPEYRDATLARTGSWREPPTAPVFNSGFRDALVDVGIVAVGCGHDHVNDYCALSTVPNTSSSSEGGDKGTGDGKPALWMCYAGASGFGGYGGWGGYERRLRVWEFDANEAKLSTWKRVEGPGDAERKARLDEGVVVEGGRVVGLAT